MEVSWVSGMKAVLGTLGTPLSLPPPPLEVFCFYLLSLSWDLKINTLLLLFVIVKKIELRVFHR